MTLGILTTSVGKVSETFIRRHIEGIAPGRTVVVSERGRRRRPAWTIDCPHAELRDPTGWYLPNRLLRRLKPGRSGLHPPPWTPSQRAVTDLLRFLEHHQVDVVLAEYLDRWHRFVGPVQDTGARFFAHAHGYDVSTALDHGWSTRYSDYAAAEGVITMSEFSRRRLIEEVDLLPSAIHVIPYGVDVPDEFPDPVAGGAAVQCLAVGRMVPKKAPLTTIRAFALAAGADRRLRLDVVGDGPLLGTAQALVDELGMGDRIRLLGARPSHFVGSLMATSQVFLQHSVTAPDGDQEGLPVAILEAMAAGLAVVASRHAGIPEAVVDAKTGALVEEHDVDGMARAIAAVTGDPVVLRELGLNGWRRAHERFSSERELASLRALLQP